MRRREAPVPAPRREPGAHRPQSRQAPSRPGRLDAAQLAGRLAALQRKAHHDPEARALPAAPDNRTGLPDRLKAGIEAMSGYSMNDVRVHYGSSKPAQLQALAYTQGTDIHVGPGQEKHLAHEAWHVVQQKQGRVRATRQLMSLGLNDDPALETEADRMGAMAAAGTGMAAAGMLRTGRLGEAPVQRRAGIEYETGIFAKVGAVPNAVPALEQDVAQDTEMAVSGQGWKVVSDNSALEFVTDPPVTTAVLATVVGNMFAKLKAIPPKSDVRKSFTQVVGIPPNAGSNFYILPYDLGLVWGKMQGTVGIPFARLGKFLELLANYDMKAAAARTAAVERFLKNELSEEKIAALPAGAERDKLEARRTKTQESLEAIEPNTKAVRDVKLAAMTTINNHVAPIVAQIRTNIIAALPPPQNGGPPQLSAQQTTELETLRGMLMLFGQYVRFSRNYGGSYAKQMFPVLARTSFASMYAALSAEMRPHFTAAAPLLVAALGRDTGDAAFGANAARLGAQGRFTLAEWITSIGTPENRIIPSKTDPAGVAVQTDRMTAPGGFTHPTDASMGALGLDNGAVVVELRGLQFTHPIASLPQFVKDLAKLEQA